MALLKDSHAPRGATIVAETELECLRLEREMFQQALSGPALRQLLDKTATKRAEDTKQSSSPSRLSWMRRSSSVLSELDASRRAEQSWRPDSSGLVLALNTLTVPYREQARRWHETHAPTVAGRGGESELAIIAPKELLKALDRLFAQDSKMRGELRPECDAVFAAADIVGNGRISFPEFLAFVMKVKNEGIRQVLWGANASAAHALFARWTAQQPVIADDLIGAKLRFFLRLLFRSKASIDSDRIRFPADLAAACRVAIPEVAPSLKHADYAAILRGQGPVPPMFEDVTEIPSTQGMRATPPRATGSSNDDESSKGGLHDLSFNRVRKHDDGLSFDEFASVCLRLKLKHSQQMKRDLGSAEKLPRASPRREAPGGTTEYCNDGARDARGAGPGVARHRPRGSLNGPRKPADEAPLRQSQRR
eukprot:3584066-Prymnesium_polylepis.3